MKRGKFDWPCDGAGRLQKGGWPKRLGNAHANQSQGAKAAPGPPPRPPSKGRLLATTAQAFGPCDLYAMQRDQWREGDDDNE